MLKLQIEDMYLVYKENCYSPNMKTFFFIRKKINCIKMVDLLSYTLTCVRLLVILPLSFYLCAFHPSTISPLTPSYLYQLQTLSVYISLAKAALESICSVLFFFQKTIEHFIIFLYIFCYVCLILMQIKINLETVFFR